MSTVDNYLIFRIQQYFIPKKENECWLWFGAKLSHGYGMITYNKKSYMVTRILYEHYYGLFDHSLLVCHKCDNPACCNHNHFFLGTTLDNIRDKLNKNRQPHGENHFSAKLTEIDIVEIRNLYSKGFSLIFLAKEYGVNGGTIHDIVNRRTWKHVN